MTRPESESKANYTSGPSLDWAGLRPGGAGRGRERLSLGQSLVSPHQPWGHSHHIQSSAEITHWQRARPEHHREDREVARMSLSKVGNQTSSQDPQAVNSR